MSEKLVLTGADPVFFLRNDVTDRWGKQILKANTKKKSLSQRVGVRTPCTLPLDPLLTQVLMDILLLAKWVWSEAEVSLTALTYKSLGLCT